MARAVGGEARMLLIEGQAGNGKSRLATEARRRAAEAGPLFGAEPEDAGRPVTRRSPPSTGSTGWP